jgi:hypothetical protein
MPKNPKVDYELLRSRLKLKQLQTRAKLQKLLTTGVMASSLVLIQPNSSLSLTVLPTNQLVSKFDLKNNIKEKLAGILPSGVEPLQPAQEKQVAEVIAETFGIDARFELDGERLNRGYGLIGSEQHLMRYPGDVLANHDAVLQSGMAPGLGAWGYFNKGNELTKDEIMREKYYLAIQTLYLPDWEIRWAKLKEWYKYRKMLVVNPINGKAVIAVVGDAGPAAWTGKHFGGSPEVMDHLELLTGKQKGPALIMFVNDPENKLPLGPIEYNVQKGQPLLTYEQ